MKLSRSQIYLAILFLAPVVIYFIWKGADERLTPLPVLGDTEMDETHTPWVVRDFTVTDQDSNVLSLADFNDKIVVANFFYATCPSICPRMNNNLHLVVEKFRKLDDVIFISHSVNPDHDSVPVLKKYSARYAYPTSKWHFVTGRKAEIYDLAENSYHVVAPSPDGEYDFIHSTQIVLLDKQHRVRGIFESNNNPTFYSELRDAIKALLAEDSHKINLKTNE
ncbi:MAG: redoxin domain-containing protein [Bacteroidetes bacterium]|nr:redoxin domain-containing protein [Bacteroidota bacterium]